MSIWSVSPGKTGWANRVEYFATAVTHRVLVAAKPIEQSLLKHDRPLHRGVRLAVGKFHRTAFSLLAAEAALAPDEGVISNPTVRAVQENVDKSRSTDEGTQQARRREVRTHLPQRRPFEAAR
jgi:hypothetical protein